MSQRLHTNSMLKYTSEWQQRGEPQKQSLTKTQMCCNRSAARSQSLRQSACPRRRRNRSCPSLRACRCNEDLSQRARSEQASAHSPWSSKNAPSSVRSSSARRVHIAIVQLRMGTSRKLGRKMACEKEDHSFYEYEDDIGASFNAFNGWKFRWTRISKRSPIIPDGDRTCSRVGARVLP